MRGQSFFVGVSGGNRNVLYALKTMAVGDTSRAESQNADRHDVRAMQRDEAVRRAHEMHGSGAPSAN